MNPTEIKELLNKWHFYKVAASNLNGVGHLPLKLDIIERTVQQLDDISRTIITRRYFELEGIEDVAKGVEMSRQAVHKRINKFVKTMSYIMA